MVNFDDSIVELVSDQNIPGLVEGSIGDLCGVGRKYRWEGRECKKHYGKCQKGVFQSEMHVFLSSLIFEGFIAMVLS
jgi:hypothetical protein